jgi:hypothetical protein
MEQRLMNPSNLCLDELRVPAREVVVLVQVLFEHAF